MLTSCDLIFTLTARNIQISAAYLWLKIELSVMCGKNIMHIIVLFFCLFVVSFLIEYRKKENTIDKYYNVYKYGYF